MKLKLKLITFLIIVTLIPVVIISTIFNMNASKVLTDNSLDDAQKDVNILSERINLFLDQKENDVLYLANTKNILEYVNNNNPSAKDKIKKDIIHDFEQFSEKIKTYYQIRYIDENGDEIVRVDSIEGRTIVIGQESLQNKNDRYYFQKSINLPKDEVYISPLDLNLENNKIENRGTTEKPIYVPVIRYATPVYNSDGKSKGIIILNIYANNFLDYFHHEKYYEQLILINEDGYYLHNEDPTKEWSWLLDTDYNINNEYPEIADKVFSQDSGVFDLKDRIISFNEIDINQEKWKVISIKEKEIVLKSVMETKKDIIISSIILFISITLLGLILTNYLIRPINKLTNYANELSSGNLNVKIPQKLLDREDELGNITLAFEKLVKSSETGLKKYVDSKINKINKNKLKK